MICSPVNRPSSPRLLSKTEPGADRRSLRGAGQQRLPKSWTPHIQAEVFWNLNCPFATRAPGHDTNNRQCNHLNIEW